MDTDGYVWIWMDIAMDIAMDQHACITNYYWLANHHWPIPIPKQTAEGALA